MSELKLIRNNLSHEDRIQARIDAFRRDILGGEGDIEYIDAILGACFDYLSQYEDEDIQNATLKVKEGLLFLGNWVNHQ